MIAASAALVLGAATAAVTAVAGPASAARVDNPYSGATVYVNPDWSANAAADGGSAIADEPTFIWLDTMSAIDGTNGRMSLTQYLDDAVAKGDNLIQFVIYDLPNRDCAALASNGEIPHGGLDTYEHDYIDPIASVMSDPKYANLRIVNVIEPDSLPNLVTNADSQDTATAACQEAKSSGEYIDGVGYALNHLGTIGNVYNYIDIGHYGWLGWSDNFTAFPAVAMQAATASGATPADVQGFVSNTAGYSPTTEPYFTVTDSVNGTSVRQSTWVDWNDYVDEQSFDQDMRGALVSAGFSSGIGMLIDTGRNGWGGPDRPTGTSTSTDLNTYVDQSRIDRRPQVGDWCNQNGAGIGARPTASPASGIDAYVWVKPPGESDGDTSTGEEMCDPNYGGNARNGNNPTNALPNPPKAGQWFPAEFHMLLANAYPALSGGGGTGDTTPPSAPTSLSVTGTTSGSVSLSWAASTDDTGVTGYDVYRNGSLVGTSAVTSFTDAGLSASTSYTYTVKAYDAAGNLSAASNSVAATTSSGGGTGGSGCTAAYHVDNDWGSGFTATVTVADSGSAAIAGWKVTWTYGGNQQVTNYWSATLTQSGTSVTAANAGYNGAVAAGSSTSFGFQASYTGGNAAPTLTCTAS
jgi:cellulose 1,4-beta-cellobiosidase